MHLLDPFRPSWVAALKFSRNLLASTALASGNLPFTKTHFSRLASRPAVSVSSSVELVSL